MKMLQSLYFTGTILKNEEIVKYYDSTGVQYKSITNYGYSWGLNIYKEWIQYL